MSRRSGAGGPTERPFGPPPCPGTSSLEGDGAAASTSKLDLPAACLNSATEVTHRFHLTCDGDTMFRAPVRAWSLTSAVLSYYICPITPV